MKALNTLANPTYETPIFTIAKCLNELQNVGQVIFTLDKNGNWNFISNAWQSMFGYDQNLILGTAFKKYLSDNDNEQISADFTALLEGETNTLDGQLQFMHESGRSIWVHLLATSSKDEVGNVTGIFGSIEDIHEKRIAELLLQESNEKFQTILNSSKEIILTIDLDRNIIENVNDAISILGYKPKEWIGQNYKSWNADQRKQFHELMKLAVKSDLQVYNHQITFANKDNTEFIPFEFSTSMFSFKNSRYLLCVLRDIRERKQYEDKMASISNQLTHLINNIDDVYAIYDIKSQQFDFVSDNVENLYACDKEEFIRQGLLWKEVIHVDDFASVEAEVSQIIESNNKAEHFYRIITPVGETRMLLEKLTVGKDLNGQAEKLYIVKTDYTSIEQAEQSLLETEKKFRFISENISDFISIHDTDWNFLYASPSIRNVLGYEPEEIIGKGGFELVYHDDILKTLDSALGPIVLHKKEVQLRYRMRSKNGEYKWVETYSKPVIDSKGETSSIISSTRDVTDQVNAESMLRASEERFRLLSENSNDVIAVYDLKGNYTYVSPSSIQVLGYEPNELIGKHPDIILSRDDESRHVAKASIAALLEDHESRKFIRRILTKGGEAKSMEVWIQPIIKNDKIIAIQASSRDVTEREKLLIDLEQSLEKERELNELRSMFVATASHQFRTPLTVIQSGVEIMELYLEDLPLEKQKPFQKQFNRIQEEVERLHYLMSDILVLGRADAGRTPFNPTQGDIVDFCKDIIEKYNNRYEENRSLILTLEGKSTPVDFDQTLIGHTIENIISNAYKYSSEGNLNFHIAFADEKVTISITDHGIGIPEEDLKNLFQPFYRATNTDEIEGTGLGLAIMKEFVDKHGGEIIVTSVLNKGTTLSVILPVKQNNR